MAALALLYSATTLAGSLCGLAGGAAVGQERRSDVANLVSEKPPSAASPEASPERCPQATVDVTASSVDQRRLACSAAADALVLLARCSITVQKPLQVHIVSEVRHPFSGPIFGLFDPKNEKVLVTQFENIPILVSGTNYEDLPLPDFFRSLIVHEVVHGVMHQNLRRPAASHAAYEYPAYALQIETLPPKIRDKFLQSFDQAAIKGDSTLFSDAVLFFDPYFFAARAYHHFKASANGCAHLTGLLVGEVGFIATPHVAGAEPPSVEWQCKPCSLPKMVLLRRADHHTDGVLAGVHRTRSLSSRNDVNDPNTGWRCHSRVDGVRLGLPGWERCPWKLPRR